MTLQRRIGILGGTFDPIHSGHLEVAVAATRILELSEVLLMPCCEPPHRRPPAASAHHRFAMAAIAGLRYERLRVSDLEVRTAGPSYTSDTLDRLLALGYDRSQLIFITGADAFAEIATWKDYPALLDRSHFAVVSRPGQPAASLRERLPDLSSRMIAIRPESASGVLGAARSSIFLVDAATSNVSSTSVRHRIRTGEPIDGLVPDDVARYIARHGLYRSGASANELHD